MAADTSLKRYSAINIASPWRGLNLVSDATIPFGERYAAMYLYGGIEGGIGLVVEPGIALSTSSFPVRTPPIDFVHSAGWISSNIPKYRKVIDLGIRRAARDDDSELREMMQLYSLWKKAA